MARLTVLVAALPSQQATLPLHWELRRSVTPMRAAKFRVNNGLSRWFLFTLELTGNVQLGALAKNTILEDTVEEAAEEAVVGGATLDLVLGAAGDGLAGTTSALGLGDSHGGEGFAGNELARRLRDSGGGGQEESERREGVHFEGGCWVLERLKKVEAVLEVRDCERL